MNLKSMTAIFALALLPLITQAESVKISPAKMPPTAVETLKTWEPHEQVEATFKGYNLRKVLESTFGPSWSQAKAVTFVCKDGYRSQIRIETVKKFSALLATEWIGHDFKVNNGKKIDDLAPFYLVWESPKGAETRGQHFWPWQVVAIEILR